MKSTQVSLHLDSSQLFVLSPLTPIPHALPLTPMSPGAVISPRHVSVVVHPSWPTLVTLPPLVAIVTTTFFLTVPRPFIRHPLAAQELILAVAVGVASLSVVTPSSISPVGVRARPKVTRTWSSTWLATQHDGFPEGAVPAPKPQLPRFLFATKAST